MNILKVSIITVVSNGEKFIEQTIQSVLNQTYEHIEYIIIDNQSTDGTLEILNRYSDRLLFISEKDNGIYEAMNKGISMSSGELIGIINSDDWYEPNAVKTIVDSYYNHSNCDIFHGLLRYINTNQEVEKIVGHGHGFLKDGMIEHPTCFVHRKVYETILFNEHYYAASDYDFMIRASKIGFGFYFIEQVIANFRNGGASETFRSAKETLAIQQKHRLISIFKQYILTVYFWLKLKK